MTAAAQSNQRRGRRLNDFIDLFQKSDLQSNIRSWSTDDQIPAEEKTLDRKNAPYHNRSSDFF
jgi:hypothetical protein